jgi:hypothetical protein
MVVEIEETEATADGTAGSFSVLRTQKGNGSVCPFLHDLNHVVSVELAEGIK